MAVRVTLSPLPAPETDTVGVESEVMSSELDVPESDDAARSGAPGEAGPLPSTVIDNVGPAVDWLPAGSRSVALTVQLPSVSAGRSHDVAGKTYEQLTDVAPFEAVNVIVSPFDPPEPVIVGVVSEVISSVDDVPVSDAAARSGAPGAAGAEVSTVIGSADPADDWFPAASVTLAVTDHVPSVRVVRSHDDAVGNV